MADFTMPPNGLSAIDSMAWLRDQGCLVALWHPTENRLLWKQDTFAKKNSEQLRAAWLKNDGQRYLYRPLRIFIVLDIDGANAADRWRAMQRKYRIQNTRIVRTPSGGLHVYLRVPPDADIRHGVDVMRDEGFSKVDVFTHKSALITGPGSYRRESGGKVAGRYAWCTPQKEMAHASESLIAALKPPPLPEYTPAERKAFGGEMHPVCQSILDDDLAKVAHCPEGSRNQTLFSVAANLFAMAAAGEIPEPGLVDLLVAATKQNGIADAKEDGLATVRKTIESGRKRGFEKPRCLASYRENYDRKRAADQRAVVQSNPVGRAQTGKGPSIG